MWILIVYIGMQMQLGQISQGGPVSAEFTSKGACESALGQLLLAFGEERDFDQRFQLDAVHNHRIWTIKGLCVPKAVR